MKYPVARDVEIISEHVSSIPDGDAPPPVEVPPEDLQKQRAEWVPSLNPTQLDIYNNDSSRFILGYGERGSGKSVGMLHKVVKHCYNEFNALAAIVVGIKRTAIEGGAWHKLLFDVLPQWKAGVGLSHTDSKQSTTKDDYVFVSNKYGGWSRIVLISMPVESFVRERARGLEFSTVFVDEGSTLESDIYFSALVQQLGRRPNIIGQQQYLCATNPEGPSHWLYKRFFDKPRKEDGSWDKRYATYHVPISENLGNLPEGYYENVLEAVSDDHTEYRRLVLGEWVDRPSGEAMFKGYFNEALHMRGDALKGTRILPKVGYDLILGYDLGTANSSISFLQNIPTREKDVWLAFDEMVYTDAYIPYTQLVPAIMRRIAFWNKTCGTKFSTIHISDSSAFNMFRATDGTYDALEVERLSTEMQKDFPDVDAFRMIPCPKYNGSVAARVKTVMKFLGQDRLLVSASCLKTKQMFMNLEPEKPKEGKYMPESPFAPKRCKHLHVFDSLSYALFFFELGQSPLLYKNVNPPELVPMGTIRK